MATMTGSWSEANIFQKLMIVAQGLLITLAYFATVSGFADLMNIHFTGSMTAERVVQLLFVFAVATAVVMAMLIGLHTMLDRERRFTGRATGAVAYLFFLFWSIAFGYGFFWKTFAAEDFTRGQFTQDTAVIQSEVRGIVDTLRNVEDQANRAAELAAARSLEESRPGGGRTCTNNPNSAGAAGPLTTARKNFADDAASQATRIETDWIKPLQAEAGEINWRLRALDPSLNAGLLATDPPREGQPGLKDAEELDRIRASVAQGSKGRKNEYDQVATRANNFVIEAIRLKSSLGADAQAKFEALAKDMSESQGRLDPRWCEDLELADAMRKAAAEISNLPEPQPISLNFLEGSAAARYATINLARNAIAGVTGQLGLKLPETIGAKKASPLGENDIIALYATAAIDFALFVVTILSRPPNQNRSMFQKLRRIGRKPDSISDDPDDLEFDVKQSGRSLEMRLAAHEARLEARRQRRRQTEDFVNEDTADIAVEDRQQVVLQRRGVSVREQLTRVLGNEALAREVALRASETIQRIGKRLYFAISRSDDSDANVINRRFANFLNINPGLFKVRPLEIGNRRDDMLRAEIAARLKVSTHDLIDVFEIESAFGNALLMLPYAPSEPAHDGEAGAGPDPAPRSHAGDVPPRGNFDDNDILVDTPPKEARKPDPSQARGPSPEVDAFAQTAGDAPNAGAEQGPGAYAEDHLAPDEKANGNWVQRQWTKLTSRKTDTAKKTVSGGKSSRKKDKKASEEESAGGE